MSKPFQLLTCLWLAIAGGYMLVFTPTGITHLCVGCGNRLTNIMGLISIIIGFLGLASLARSSGAARE
ncbi:MAG TPA: hypothetical protein VMI35_00470 [Puia sp.]|nr:hypothetical protein [Puia sp.]